EEVNNEIVVTNLQMYSFPTIRYNLGDYIKLAASDATCSCGKNHLILSEVMGRIGETVYGVKNIYPSLYFYYIFKNLSENQHLSLEYQVVQNRKGHLAFNIVSGLSQIERKILSKEIESYFKDDMYYDIRSNSTFELTKGKQKSFISTVNNEPK